MAFAAAKIWAGGNAGGKRRKPLQACVAFALPVVLLGLIFALAGVWPFGGNTALTGDLGGIYLPVVSSLRQGLQAGDIAYSFGKSLRGEMFSSYMSYGGGLALLALLPIPTAFLADAVTVYYLVVVGCVGLCMYFYLAARPAAKPWWPVAFAVCYALCGYTMAFLQNTMWLPTLAFAPLAALCIERLDDRRWRVGYTVVLAAAILNNYYTGWMLCLFCLLYWAFVTFKEKQAGKAYLKKAGWFGLHSLLAGGLCAVVLLPVLGMVSGAKGGLFSLELGAGRNFSLLELPTLLVTGNFQTGYLVSWLPMIYCGYPVLLGAVLYFLNRRIPLQERLLALAVLGVFLLSFWLELPNLVWHGFEAPVWFSFRYSFLCVLFAIRLAFDCCMRLDGLPKWALPAGVAALAGGLAFAAVSSPDIPGFKVALTALFLALAAGLLFMAARQGRAKQWAVPVLVAVVAAEMFANGYLTQREFEFNSRDGYIEQAETMAYFGGELDLHAPYRAEKQWFYTLNDPLLQGYHGASFFNSVQDNAPLEILRALGFVSRRSTTYGLGAGGNPAAQILLGFRYMGAQERPLPHNYQLAAQTGGYAMGEEPRALPLAFAAFAPAPLAKENSVAANQNALYRTLTGVEEDILLPAEGWELKLENLSATVEGEATRYRVVDPAKPSAIVLQGEVPQAGNLLFTMESMNWVGVTLRAGDFVYDGYGGADTGGLLDCGPFAAGQLVELRIEIGANEILLGPPALYLESADALAHHLAVLETGLPTELELKGGRLEAEVEATAGQVLFTTIPMDAGWSAIVNGRQVPIGAGAGWFITVPLAEGSNTVVLQYQLPNLALGAFVSAVALAVLLEVVFPRSLTRRRNAAFFKQYGSRFRNK